eukprot:jgi/Picsp_1/5290/NSC_02652-R1_ubiquitin system component cue protein
MIPYICGGGGQPSSSGTPLHVDDLIGQVDKLLELGESGGLLEYVVKYGGKDGVFEFIESFLAYSPRPFDAVFENLSGGSLELFLFGADKEERGCSRSQETEKALQPLLTLVCFMDVAALYGTGASVLKMDTTSSGRTNDSVACSEVLQGMLRMGPWLEEDLRMAGIDVAGNMMHVVEAAVQMLRMKGTSKESNGGTVDAYVQDVVDTVLYLRDGCLVLCCMMVSCNQCAGLLLEIGMDLVETLGYVHDVLVPAVYGYCVREAQRIKNAKDDDESDKFSDIIQWGSELEIASERAVDLLIDSIMVLRISSSGCSSGPGGSSGIDQISVERGEKLMHALTTLSIREDDATRYGHSMGQALSSRFKLKSKIKNAVDSRAVFLDEAQMEYTMAILGVADMQDDGSKEMSNADGSLMETGALSKNDNSLDIVSLVSNVTEILPDYGEGFVASCLDVLGHNPERVIHALLTGPLPREVDGLDKNMSLNSYLENKEGNKIDVEFPSLPGASSSAMPGDAEAVRPRLAGPHVLTSRFLDTKESSYKERLQQAACSYEWEYEDEYDDSYDDLLHIGAPPEEETEPSLPNTGSTGVHVDQKRADKNKSRYWVLDGRIYNYAKKGAQEVNSLDSATKIVAEQKMSRLEIHGLGPSGNQNVPVSATGKSKQETQRGRGRGRSSFAYKDKNKAAIGNHHRKDRATQKMGKGMQ